MQSLKGYPFKIDDLHIQTFVTDGQTGQKQEESRKSYIVPNCLCEIFLNQCNMNMTLRLWDMHKYAHPTPHPPLMVKPKIVRLACIVYVRNRETDLIVKTCS